MTIARHILIIVATVAAISTAITMTIVTVVGAPDDTISRASTGEPTMVFPKTGSTKVRIITGGDCYAPFAKVGTILAPDGKPCGRGGN